MVSIRYNLLQSDYYIHSYNTRSSTSGKFYVKSSILEIQHNFFSRLGVKLWNKIPSYITNLPKKAFKRVLCKLLFDILEMEDYYIEIPLIIKKSRFIDMLGKGFNICFSCLYALQVSKRCIN